MYAMTGYRGLGDNETYSAEVSARLQAVAQITVPAWVPGATTIGYEIAASIYNGSLTRGILTILHEPIDKLRDAANKAMTPPEWEAIVILGNTVLPDAYKAIEAVADAAGAMDTGDHSTFQAWRDECYQIAADAKAKLGAFKAQVQASGRLTVSGVVWSQNPDGTVTGTVVATAEGRVGTGAGTGVQQPDYSAQQAQVDAQARAAAAARAAKAKRDAAARLAKAQALVAQQQDSSKKWLLIGGAALLVVGGGAYFMMRNE